MTKNNSDIKVGIFITAALGILMASLLVITGPNLWKSKSRYVSYFESVDGLIAGSKVMASGLQVGTVETVEIDLSRKQLRVGIAIIKDFAGLVRKQSFAEIATQGMLGDKFISINSGATDAELLESGSEIPTKASAGISQFVSEGEQLLLSLTRISNSFEKILASLEKNNRNDILFQGLAQTSKNMSEFTAKINSTLDLKKIDSAMKNLNEILEKVNRGNGTVGALINDPELYDDMKSLVAGTNRNRIMRNLVRETIKNSPKDQK